MDGDNRHRWDDGQLMTLLTEALADPEADCAEAPTPAAPDDRPAELSLEDVVAAGRAAFCWLDVVVTLRDVALHLGRPPEPRPSASPAASWAASPPGSTATEGR